MMGYSHTVSAAAGWLALVETGVVQVPDTPTLVVTTLACAGAGMLPDIDHHNGSIANSIPPVSRWVARIVGAVSGGHRKGTHSILGLVAFWAIAYFSASISYNGIPWASLLLAAFSGGLALRVLGAPGGWIGAIALGYAAYTTDSLTLLPWAFSVGATIHLIGDLLTTRGLLPLYPIVIKPLVASPLWKKSGYMALPILGDAGSVREKALTLALTVYIGWYAAAMMGFVEYPLQTFGLGVHAIK